MNNIWQSSEGKTDGEPSMKAILRELEKKTGFIAKPEDLKFLLNDSNYNCNVYILKVHPNTELDLIEPNKNGKWEKFFFEAYKKMVRESCITLIHTTYIELILHRIKPKSQTHK